MKPPSSVAARGFIVALTVANVGARADSGVSQTIAAAVADAARPASDRERDADRKPAEALAFADLRPGEQVAELLPGGGYFTRLFSAAVGAKGRVYAIAPPRRSQAPAGSPDPAAAVQALAADPHYSNVTVTVEKLNDFSVSAPVDLVWTSQNYHDFHNNPALDVAGLDKAIYKSLKPGGVFIVLDHAAEAGSGFRDTSTLHRIDPEAVKKEVLSAGFKFEGQSELLRNSKDPYTAPVFDASIRGKTDQFILKFRKPE